MKVGLLMASENDNRQTDRQTDRQDSCFISIDWGNSDTVDLPFLWCQWPYSFVHRVVSWWRSLSVAAICCGELVDEEGYI